MDNQPEALRLAQDLSDRMGCYDAAAAELRRLHAENERLRTAAEFAAHKLEGARIWGGMEWHYNPLHPFHYRPAMERLKDALKEQSAAPQPPGA